MTTTEIFTVQQDIINFKGCTVITVTGISNDIGHRDTIEQTDYPADYRGNCKNGTLY